MTNLQAIDLLKGLEQSLDDYCELNDEGKTAFGMAITALELFGNSEQLPSAQPKKRTEERMETHACDLIDRQAAIDALSTPHGILYPIRTVEELPSAEPRWIPATESKPKKGDTVIVTDFDSVTLAYINDLGGWMDFDGNKLKGVTAWMPLPQPWEGADE